MSISFNKPHLTGKELHYISEAHALGQLSGDGPFTRRCNAWLEQTTGSTKALLTHSCTAALDMAAILADIAPGDEVVMPSYTFSSTANAFVLRGGVPVFVDIQRQASGEHWPPWLSELSRDEEHHCRRGWGAPYQ